MNAHETAKITPGPATLKFTADGCGDIGVVADGRCIAEVFHEIRSSNERAFDEKLANARLIAEAFNVCHETGLTPRQLADQRAELLEALRELATEEYRDDDDPILHTARSKARVAIQRATGEQP